ncbi:MAG: PQQ-dependent sugar dehydrogenase [Desulfocapsaceae bacterium]|nr:PQQ-dependent sugar dehydrogenase [Desulfocapsaceae bacterium]
MTYRVEQIADGLGVIWGMTFISPEEIVFTERAGKVKKLNLTSGTITELSGAPRVWARGQGGMLDIAVPQDFKAGDWTYFTYSKEVDDSAVTTLARAKLDGERFTDWQELLITESASNTGRHFGSRIVFDSRGHVFFSVGDRGVRPNGQDLNTHAGTIIRLNLDGSVPEDNPFIAKEGLAEIWSYGHRNPQGLFYHNETGKLWSNEHGPRGGDEINLIEAGKNYGWPVVSHGKEYWGPMAVGEATSKPGMVDPLKVYIPSIAPGSLLIYSGKAFPAWKGHFFAGALAMVHLNRVVFDVNNTPVEEEQMLLELDERIRAVIEGPDGWLYFSTDSGTILRLRPDNS